MKRFRNLVLSLVVGLGATPAWVTAQACDPLTFTFTTVGRGCTTGGSRTPPSLSARTVPGLRTCVLEFLFEQHQSPFPIPVGTLLVGARDPQLPLPFAPGCALHAQPQLLLPMSPDIGVLGSQSASFVVPVVPALMGVFFYAQGVWVPSAGIGLSNGVRTDIS